MIRLGWPPAEGKQLGSRPSGFFLILRWFVTTPPRELKTKTIKKVNLEIDILTRSELLSVTVKLLFGFGLNYVQLRFSYGVLAFVTG